MHRGSRIKRSFLHDQHHLPSRHDSSGAPIPSSRVTDRVMVAMLQAHRHRRVICDDRGSREDAIRHVRGTRGVLTSLSFFFFSFSKSGRWFEEKDRPRFFFRKRTRRTRGSARSWHYGRSFGRKNDPLGGVILIMRVDRRFVPALFSFSPCPRRREACEHFVRLFLAVACNNRPHPEGID